MFGKLLFRVLLIALAMVTVPLAIQNRTPVTLILDPTVLLAGEPRASVTLPLFVALLLALGLGLLVGYALGRMKSHGRAARRQSTADNLAARTMAAHHTAQNTPQKPAGTRDQTAVSAASGSAAARAALSGGTGGDLPKPGSVIEPPQNGSDTNTRG